MAKRKKKKKSKAAKGRSAAKRTVKRAKRAAKKAAKKPKPVRAKRKKKASRKKAAVKRKIAPRRTEAEMSWSEVRQSRRKKSDNRANRIEREFYRKVNMTPQALDSWIKSQEGGRAAADNWSGLRTLEIIRKKKSKSYTPEDHAHMRKVIGYVGRHSTRRPGGDLKTSPWRYGLMNWGHDPLK